ncbi:ROK family transcriptional regulator [Jatrophihabitans fulvus]
MRPSVPSDSGPASAQGMRRQNRSLVLAAVAAGPARSRAVLAAELGLSRATVSAIVEDLVHDRLVRELDADRSLPGRPAVPLDLDPDALGVLGVELGVDHATALVLDLTGAVRARHQRELGRVRTPAATLRRVAAVARDTITAAGLRVDHGALAVPGLLDRNGTVRRLPNLPGWEGTHVAGRLATDLGLAVRADNEANLAALADLALDDLGPEFLHVSGEIGVGAALVHDGRVYRGAHGFAGELGHVAIEPDGPECGCGARGCLEQYAGRHAVLRAAGVDTVAALMSAADRGEPRACDALAAAGHALGRALADAVNLVDVPVIVLGGLYATLFPWLAPPVRDQLASRVLGRGQAEVQLVRSPRGADAGATGAALDVLADLLAGRIDPAPTRSAP